MINKIIPFPIFHTIGDAISTAILTEINNQRDVLATGDYKTMLDSFFNVDGNLSIWRDRYTPFDVNELNAINVRFEGVSEREGSTSRTQKAEANYGIDVEVANTDDITASKYIQWMGSTIRGILMHPDYTQLKFVDKSIIGRRWVSAVRLSQPNDPENTGYLIAGQLSFSVNYDEKNLLNEEVAFAGNDSAITANNGQFTLITDQP